MKKHRQRPQQKSKRQTASSPDQPASPERRNLMRFAKNAAIGLPIVAIGCFFAIKKVQADLVETDLTQIGNGTPTIVQIHDPQCAECNVLQGQTRAALGAYDAEDYTYLVANLTTDSGYAFANQFGVSHVTLLLFDGTGEVTEAVRGPLPDTQLESILARHVMGDS